MANNGSTYIASRMEIVGGGDKGATAEFCAFGLHWILKSNSNSGYCFSHAFSSSLLGCEPQDIRDGSFLCCVQ